MPTNMPNVTHVQILAGLMWIASQAVAFGVIQHAPSQQMLSAVSTLLAIGLSWADSHLRGKRVIAHAMATSSTDTAVTEPPVTVQTPPVVGV